jgi:hypothetical protein
MAGIVICGVEAEEAGIGGMREQSVLCVLGWIGQDGLWIDYLFLTMRAKVAKETPVKASRTSGLGPLAMYQIQTAKSNQATRLAMNQFKFDLATDIYVLETSKANDAPDLVALGTDHSVQILLVADHSVQSIASFHIGSRITALAWSPTTVSPSRSDEWLVELVFSFPSRPRMTIFQGLLPQLPISASIFSQNRPLLTNPSLPLAVASADTMDA